MRLILKIQIQYHSMDHRHPTLHQRVFQLSGRWSPNINSNLGATQHLSIIKPQQTHNCRILLSTKTFFSCRKARQLPYQQQLRRRQAVQIQQLLWVVVIVIVVESSHSLWIRTLTPNSQQLTVNKAVLLEAQHWQRQQKAKEINQASLPRSRLPWKSKITASKHT